MCGVGAHARAGCVCRGARRRAAAAAVPQHRPSPARTAPEPPLVKYQSLTPPSHPLCPHFEPHTQCF